MHTTHPHFLYSSGTPAAGQENSVTPRWMNPHWEFSLRAVGDTAVQEQKLWLMYVVYKYIAQLQSHYV